MEQLPLLFGLGYLAYLAWIGLRGEAALLGHFYLILVLVVGANLVMVGAMVLGWKPPWN